MNENTNQIPNSVPRKSNWWFLIGVFAIVIALFILGISLQYKIDQERYQQLKSKLDQQKTAENKAFGEKLDAYTIPIIQAIEQYKNDKGAYPDDLTDLVPAYLDEQPYAPFNDELKYRPETEIGPPFYFSFTGDYKFSLNSEAYVYCPVAVCKIPMGQGTYRINSNWVYEFGKW